MNCKEHFWIFGHLGLGDHIVCNALYRHYAGLHKERVVIIPIWDHNLAAVQWMLQDVPNIFFYPVETEQQLLTCRNSIGQWDKFCLGFYETRECRLKRSGKPQDYSRPLIEDDSFNPVKWDSEFYRQVGLDPELKWKVFKLPEFQKDAAHGEAVFHDDGERGFRIRAQLLPDIGWKLDNKLKISETAYRIYHAKEIHCIDSSMLNLADLMETPYCKRFVFHRYARKGLPPSLRKSWEILD